MIWVSHPLSLIHGSNSLLLPGKKKKIKHFGNLREAFCFISLSPNLCIITQGPAVQRTDNAIQQINPYPADKC